MFLFPGSVVLTKPSKMGGTEQYEYKNKFPVSWNLNAKIVVRGIKFYKIYVQAIIEANNKSSASIKYFFFSLLYCF